MLCKYTDVSFILLQHKGETRKGVYLYVYRKAIVILIYNYNLGRYGSNQNQKLKKLRFSVFVVRFLY